MLERDVPPDEMQRYLEVIRTEARRLAALLNDLLDLQRVEQRTLELRLDNVDLNDLLATQVTLYSAQSDDHELHFSPSSEPLLIRGDRDRLAQVIGNLFSNAIKYSPEGGSVDISAELVGSRCARPDQRLRAPVSRRITRIGSSRSSSAETSVESVAFPGPGSGSCWPARLSRRTAARWDSTAKKGPVPPSGSAYRRLCPAGIG